MPSEFDPKQKVQIVQDCYADPVLFFRVVLNDWFTLPMPWFHRGVIAVLLHQTDFLTKFGLEHWEKGDFVWNEAGLSKILRHFVWKERPDDPACPEQPVFVRRADGHIDILTTDFTLMMIPRGFAKTTLVNACVIYQILYKLVRFILYISETAPHAEMQLQNVKTQLADNDRIRLLFGNVAPERNAALKWRDDYIETITNVTVAARGRGGQIRGLLTKGNRPDLIICDDIEDEESVKTPEQRKKAKKWLIGTVKPALKKIGGRGRMVVLGTALHADSLLMGLKNDPTYMSIIFGAIDRDGEPLWTANMSLVQLEAEKQSFILLGELAAYYLEYFNMIRTDDTALFDASMIRYQIMHRTEFAGVAECCDPAISELTTADFCSFGVTGITTKGGIHVLDFFSKRGMSPSEQIDKFFELHFLWLPSHHGIESNAYQKSLVFQVKAEMFARSQTHGPASYFDIQPITNKAAKPLRIKGTLAPRYRAGYVTHQRRFPQLETQLIDYPGKHDDGPDVIAMCIQMLDPFSGFYALPESVEMESMKSLDLELGEWRNAP